MEGIEFRASSRHLGDGTRVVAVAGEVDLYTAPEFERALESNGSAGGRIVVDLSECTFLDSTGLAILVQATRHGGSNPFLVVACGLEVLRALQVTGLDRRFVLHPTLQSALNGGAVSGWSDKEARNRAVFREINDQRTLRHRRDLRRRVVADRPRNRRALTTPRPHRPDAEVGMTQGPAAGLEGRDTRAASGTRRRSTRSSTEVARKPNAALLLLADLRRITKGGGVPRTSPTTPPQPPHVHAAPNRIRGAHRPRVPLRDRTPSRHRRRRRAADRRPPRAAARVPRDRITTGAVAEMTADRRNRPA
jgi:anti-sigma B factor antagonist